MNLFDIVSRSSNMNKIKEGINDGLPLLVSYASSGEKSLVVSNTKQKSIFVCSDFVTMSEVKQNLLAQNLSVGTVTMGVVSPIYSRGQDVSAMQNFISTMFDFYLGKIDVLIVLSEALAQRLPDKSFLEKYLIFETQKQYNFSALAQSFISLGYKRCDYVSAKGEFAIRGDIVDIFSINYDQPIRLDFFGDELENISFFDISDMKNIGNVNEINIYPTSFYVLENIDKKQIQENIKNSLKNSKINADELLKINNIVYEICEKIENNCLDINNAFIAPFLYFKDNLLSLFSENLVFYDEPKKIYDDVFSFLKNNNDSIINLIQKGELLTPHLDFFCDINNIFNANKYCIFANFSSDIISYEKEISLRNIGARKYTFDYKALVNDINIYLKSNYIIILLCGSQNSKKSIGEFLATKGILWRDNIFGVNPKAQVVLTDIDFPSSFSFLEANIVAIGTSDLVKKSTKQKMSSNKIKKKNVFYLPKVGDYVVHNIHGVGKCIDLKRLNLNGSEKDYFIIEYKGGDRLYLPSEQADAISAFLGGDKQPSLNKIGGAEFAKAKERVKNSVQKLAINLVEIYSQREKAKGFVYSSDNYLMDEFENAFEYEETPDQLLAIEEIKKDMYSSKIMDRLICGDVGYGKTEIALRAAYQAVLDGKQVCIIAPTTILSQQHYNTAKKRMTDFMCNVEVLNRFRNKSQQTEILKRLKNGEIDIICGTHRLLSNDVIFKDLGLLILDEEQRFGVADKEKIKELKKDVDVLSLSATPIPRTLNMAMTGIRDISIIETPPKNRLPIQTYVTEESDALIEDACTRELARGGQVLIVYNRVESIYDVCNRVQNMLPNARIGVAHGQMPEKMLEDVIIKLYDGEYDILIATTLIESGIDLPLANTLIVLNSDMLGLAQLYQLRGRIGRSDKLAYAYFTYNPNKILTEDAYKRLDAIMEFSELGSGFKIAMRDLEIRGAGNVLGKEQHGHMEKVGYDMYCKLLDEAVKSLKGEDKKQELPLKVDIVCPAYIPEDYMAGQEERIKAYSEISEISSLGDIEVLSKQYEEAFGKLPQQIEYLMKIALIKNLCLTIGAKRIFLDSNNAKIFMYKTQDIVPKKVATTIENYKDYAVLRFEEVPIIVFDIKNKTLKDKLDFVIKFLIECTNV